MFQALTIPAQVQIMLSYEKLAHIQCTDTDTVRN